MSKIKYLFEAFVGFVIAIPAYFLDAIAEIIKNWDNSLVFFKGPALFGAYFLQILFYGLSLLVLADAIYGLFTNESLIKKIKDYIEKH